MVKTFPTLPNSTPFTSKMAPKKAGEPAAEGTRKSSRVTSKPAETTATPSAAAKAKAAPKRKAEEDSESKDDEPKKKTAPASKGKAASSATTSQLKVGDALPNETLVDEEGKDIVISGESIVVERDPDLDKQWLSLECSDCMHAFDL